MIYYDFQIMGYGVIGGYTDHIHILVMLSKNITLCQLVEKVKSHSSKWIKRFGGDYRGFYWPIYFSKISCYICPGGRPAIA